MLFDAYTDSLQKMSLKKRDSLFHCLGSQFGIVGIRGPVLIHPRHQGTNGTPRHRVPNWRVSLSMPEPMPCPRIPLSDPFLQSGTESRPRMGSWKDPQMSLEECRRSSLQPRVLEHVEPQQESFLHTYNLDIIKLHLQDTTHESSPHAEPNNPNFLASARFKVLNSSLDIFHRRRPIKAGHQMRSFIRLHSDTASVELFVQS